MERSKRMQLAFFPVLAALLLLGGCKEKGQQAAMQQGPPEVEVVTLKPETVSLSTELPGRTKPYKIAEVRPQVSGIILKRNFTEGSEVKAGQVLYQIDPAPYKATYASAEAALERAKAVEKSAKLKAERYRTLVKTKAVSALDQVEMEATWKQAVADIAAARASLESARINLAYTKVTAPISGRIGKSSVTEGALVTAQQSTALATVQQLDPMYIDVSQSSVELLRLKREIASGQLSVDAKGQAKVSVILEDGTTYDQQGSLEFADVTVNESTGAVTLRALAANPDHELLPGMFVRARLDKGQRQNALLVPRVGLTRDTKGNALVMVVNDKSVVESRQIVTGAVLGEHILANSGLKAGDKVIVAGLQKIRAGVPVKAVEQAKTEEKVAAQATGVSNAE